MPNVVRERRETGLRSSDVSREAPPTQWGTGKALHRMLFGHSDDGGSETSEEEEDSDDMDFDDDDEYSDLDPEERILQRAIMRNFMAREKKRTID